MLTWILLLVLGGAFVRSARRRSSSRDDLVPTLEAAEKAGIITTTQREQIVALHADSTRGESGGVGWLAAFAGLFVVAGVSLLVASNWESIGPSTRVVSFLVLLAVVGEAALRARDGEAAIALPLELLWFFLPLLGIGLYVQTFQISGGDPLHAALLWLALSAPVAWTSRRPLVASLHVAAMVAVVFTGNFLGFAGDWLLPGLSRSSLSLLDGGTFTAWTLTALLLATIVAESLRLLPRPHRFLFLGVLPAWVLGLLVANTPFHVAHPGWLALAAVSLATTWLAALGAWGARADESSSASIAWLAAVWILSFTWHVPDAFSGEAGAGGILLALLVTGVAVLAVLRSPSPGLGSRPGHAGRSRLLMLATLGVESLYIVPLDGMPWLAGVANNVLLASAATGLMWQGAEAGEALFVNLGVGVLLLLLLTRFLDVFGSLFASGIGLIVAGMLLAGLSLALERTRRRLLRSSQEVTQ